MLQPDNYETATLKILIVMRILLAFLLIASFFNTSLAQKHDNVWIHIFPEGLMPPFPATLINFGGSPPQMLFSPTQFSGNTTQTIVSDKNGLPLFYTNGYNIYHMGGAIMENGDSLLPINFQNSYPTGSPANLSVMVIPRPRYEGDYYVLQFYIEPNWTYTPKILLSLVSGATGSGFGTVTYKNKVLFEGNNIIDFFSITKHANGRDWWVVFSDNDVEAHTRSFYSLCLLPDSNFIVQQQDLSGYEPVPNNPWEIYTFQKLFSPNGKYYISHNPIYGTRVHLFDRCTGELGDPITIPFKVNNQGRSGWISVSPNSKYLYTTNTDYVFQYDLEASNIEASKDTVAAYDGYLDSTSGTPILFGYPCLARDGKIYYFQSGIDWVHIIEEPNKKGPGCHVVQRAFKMPWKAASQPFFPNYRLGPIDGSTCDSLGIDNEPLADFWWFSDSTLTVRFSDNSFYEPSHWAWDFGDGGMSQDTSPVHVFPETGTYNVCLTVSNQYGANSVCKDVTLGGTAAKTLDEPSTFKVFPNPTTGLLRLEYHGASPVTVQAYNLLGQLVLQETTYERQVDLAGLATGLYLLEFSVGGKRYWEKALKKW